MRPDVSGADVLLDERTLVAWGRRIGASLSGGAFLALSGPLGAGKSVLARAVARGLGVEGPVPSPTYTLLHHYPLPSGRTFLHADLYRLSSPEEVEELGWGELGNIGAVAVVEWPERAGRFLPADRWDVHLSIPLDRPELRSVACHRRGRADPPRLPAP